jgi:hypothetical protein
MNTETSNMKSTGTTIISIPYNKGVIVVSDTQATDLNSFTKYYTPNKSDCYFFQDFEPEVDLIASSAGYASYNGAVVAKIFNLLKQHLTHFNIELNSIKTQRDFIDLFNNLCGRILKQLSPLEHEISSRSVCLLTVKTKNFVLSLETNFDAGTCFSMNIYDKARIHSNLLAVGSGGRYILGAALKEDVDAPFCNRSLDQVLQWVSKNFKRVITRDLASSGDHGYSIVIVDKDKKTEVRQVE